VISLDPAATVGLLTDEAMSSSGSPPNAGLSRLVPLTRLCLRSTGPAVARNRPPAFTRPAGRVTGTLARPDPQHRSGTPYGTLIGCRKYGKESRELAE
jgi:hypothetical protein